jgi:hypothetical protein
MRRAWLIKSAIWLFIGLVITAGIAWSVGYAGVTKNGAGQRYYSVLDHVAVASIESGNASTLVAWLESDPRTAAWEQYSRRINAYVAWEYTDTPPPMHLDDPAKGPRWASFWRSDGSHKGEWRVELATGWPLVAFSAASASAGGTSNMTNVVRRARDGRLTAIPVRPVLPGVIVDSLFWGLGFGVVWTGGAMIVRRRRSWACKSCGYDRRGLAADTVCPECGAKA